MDLNRLRLQLANRIKSSGVPVATLSVINDMKEQSANAGEISYRFAKLLYLEYEKDLSLIFYLISFHSQLKFIYQNSKIRNSLSNQLENKEEVYRQLKSLNIPKVGFMLFLDNNIPRNIGHSIIDFDSVLREKYSISEESINYHRHLLSHSSQQIKERNIKLEGEKVSLEKETYAPIGIEYLINQIFWEQINSENIIELYWKNLKE